MKMHKSRDIIKTILLKAPWSWIQGHLIATLYYNGKAGRMMLKNALNLWALPMLEDIYPLHALLEAIIF
jgi:hypothetical protein